MKGNNKRIGNGNTSRITIKNRDGKLLQEHSPIGTAVRSCNWRISTFNLICKIN